MSGYEHAPHVVGQARLHKPADPNKPVTHNGRRVLRILEQGGILRKQRRFDPTLGRRHLPHPDPARFYYILSWPRDRGKAGSGLIGPDRLVRKGTVEVLQEKGYLARSWAAGQEEATREDLTPLGRKILQQTDDDGNWLKEE